jgi:hypothetical protein
LFLGDVYLIMKSLHEIIVHERNPKFLKRRQSHGTKKTGLQMQRMWKHD